MLEDHNLNPKQLEAVNHVEGPALVLAGAGSGKTRVVTFRIANLIHFGILPSDILAVTFTNKAAEEMQLRVHKMQKAHVLTSTFHSLGARILRESCHALGYRSDFTIYDEEDSLKLLKTCLTQFNIKPEKGVLKGIKQKISAAKNDLVSPDQVTHEGFAQEDRLFPDIYATYQAKLKSSNAMDFDDLLFLSVTLLLQHEDIRSFYQKKWLFLLIDEYQDTNFAQYTLAKTLVAEHQNIFVVGDPDQSIYSWRGARYENILNFENDFPGAKVIKLEQNYRSTNMILHAANAVISNNHSRMDKSLWSELGEGEKITYFEAENEQKEMVYVINQLQKYRLDEKIPLEDMVVFYRTNAQSRVLEDLLLNQNIPYVIVGSTSFYQRREIKDIFSFLTMICSDYDPLAFSRSIQIPKRGIGPTTLHKLIEDAYQSQLPIFQYISNPEKTRISQKQRHALQEYVQMIQHLRNLSLDKTSVHDLISETIYSTNYLSVLKEDPETSVDRKENLDQLISKAAEWEEKHDEPTLAKFLEELTLRTHQETESFSKLQLMTLHNSKGLEFRIVFMIGLEEDLLPHANSKESYEELEEERRLFYVGMTRAKQKLYLTSSSYRYIWGSPRLMRPSRFLNELPSENLEKIQSSPQIQDTQDDSFEFHPGDTIFHDRFGEGIVQKVYHTSYGPTYDILFKETNLVRSLVAKYAKLKKSDLPT